MRKITLSIIMMQSEAALANIACICSIQFGCSAECDHWTTASLGVFYAIWNRLQGVPLATLITWNAKESAVFGILAVLSKVWAISWAILILVCVGSHLLGDTACQTGARVMTSVLPRRFPFQGTTTNFEEKVVLHGLVCGLHTLLPQNSSLRHGEVTQRHSTPSSHRYEEKSSISRMN
jgi:hypothetical protein